VASYNIFNTTDSGAKLVLFKTNGRPRTDEKYRAKIKNTSNNLLPNQGGVVWCTGTSIAVFF
jgi:hypothetical protein